MITQSKKRRNEILVGEKYGEWTVIEGTCCKDKNGCYKSRCLCSCGREVLVDNSNLRKGSSTKCKPCAAVERGLSRRKYDARTKMPEYWARYAMLQRCLKPHHPEYKNYGGRGINVYESWVESFDAFLADVGIRPSPSHSLDRIDVNGDYEPGNVRWMDPRGQTNNRRNTRKVTLRGITMPLAEWCEKLGLHYNTVTYRLNQGWTPNDALFVGVDRRKLRQSRKQKAGD